MNTSEQGITALEKREGKKNKAYKDTRGVWTIGVGHTGPNVYEGLAWTDQQIDDALKADLKTAEDCVNKYVKVPLKQHQFDALVSFIFNVGVMNFRKSTMLKDLNAGNCVAAANDFDMWHIPPEVIGRRNSEKAQFLNDYT